MNQPNSKVIESTKFNKFKNCYILLATISLLFVALIVAVLFSECKQPPKILSKPLANRFELISYSTDDSSSYSEYIMYDKETKIEYFLLQNNRYSSDAILLPIFNSDGNLKIHGVD